MLKAPLALVAMLAACTDRYGAYFVVQGDGAMAVDRVEFYFGESAGPKVPALPDHASTEPEPGLLVRRLASDSDVVMLSPPAGTLTYWVPPGGDNSKLGDYLLVIAYASNQRVGIGELFDFTIPIDDVVYKYEIPLVDYATQNIEQWGRPTPDCIRWKRDRGSHPSMVAIARGDDVDCDAFVDGDDPAKDCDPLRYCDGSGSAGCIGSAACVTLDDDCRIGTCQNQDGQRNSCTPTTCVVDQACSVCDLSAPPRELIDCVLLGDGTHLDYPVTVRPSQALCAEPYKVYLELPIGVPCQNPRVEASVNYSSGVPFDYQVSTGPGTTCLLTLTPPTPGAKFEGEPHIMISIDTTIGPLPRQTFIFGLGTRVDLCASEQTVTIDADTVSCLP